MIRLKERYLKTVYLRFGSMALSHLFNLAPFGAFFALLGLDGAFWRVHKHGLYGGLGWVNTFTNETVVV